MKTFEENWTAWIDGELTGSELTEFEATLPDRAAAEVEKQEALKLGTFLKSYLPCQAMGNEEFFQHQLQERIAADVGGSRRTTRAAEKSGGPSDGWSGSVRRRWPSSASARSL